MIRTARILGAMALGLVAAPALAASDAFIAGAAAYNEGFASDVRPSEVSDFIYCAGYWSAWSDATSDDGPMTEADLQVLDVALKPPSSHGMAIAMLFDLDETEETNAQVDLAKTEANQLLKDALGGKVEAAEDLFRSLGRCQFEEG